MSSDQGQLIRMANAKHCSEVLEANDRQTAGCRVIRDEERGNTVPSLQLEIYRRGGHKAVRIAVKHPPLKLVFAFDFNVGHNYSQHLFVNIDSRYLVGHSSSWPGPESVLRLP